MATMLHPARCRRGALGPLPVPCGSKGVQARGVVQVQHRLLRKPCTPRASKQDSQKDGDGKNPSSKEFRTEAELWGMQKDMMLSQISCINQEREAWLASQTALLNEVRELQRLHRDTVVGAYETFLVKERSYWEQQREDWEKREAALLGQLAAAKAALQQPGSGTTAAPQAAPGILPASTQVADLLRQVAPASSVGQQAPAAATSPVPAPKAPGATAATTPATAATMPGFAADLAAAIAAVDHVDVLQDAQLSQFMTRHTAASPATPPHSTPGLAPPAGNPPTASAQPPAPSTPEAREKKGPFAGGPWGGGGAVVEPAGQPRRVVEATPIETVRAPQNGPPPMLRWGDNDIYWVGRLHAALASHGFYTSDEEEGDFVFGDSTQEAVAYFQASVSLPETGVATIETWEKLLQGTPEEFPLIGGSVPQGKEGARGDGGWTSSWHEDEDEAGWSRAGAQAAAAVAPSPGEGKPEEAPAGEGRLGTNGASGSSSSGSSSSSSGGNGEAGDAGATSSCGSTGSSSSSTVASTSSSSTASNSGSSASTTSGSRDDGGKAERTAWPLVRDGDGGWEVHALQALLTQKGYRCDDDERQWWQCGSSTIEALLYFQACAGLPESGVCAEQTWRQLLATEDDPEGEKAVPAALDAVRDGEFDDDMSGVEGAAAGRVYLLGEDRWSR